MAHANCKGCKERHVGCHSKCEIYKEYRARQDALLKAKRMHRESDALEVQRTLDKATMYAKKKKAGFK